MTTAARLSLLVFFSCFLSACTAFMEVNSDGMVDEDYGKRTRGTVTEDKDIERKAAVNFSNHTGIAETADIHIHAFNRSVLLTGQVPDAKTKQLATQIAQQVRQVRGVHNELEVGEKRRFGQKSKDRFLASRVRTRLLAADQVESSRIVLITNNGTVYLMGLVTRAEGDRAIEAAKLASGIQRIVKVFEYLD